MGRHNHENSVAIPGFDDLVVLSGDDTFTPNPAQSQLYSYIAPDADAIWNDTGRLYGFRVDNSASTTTTTSRSARRRRIPGRSFRSTRRRPRAPRPRSRPRPTRLACSSSCASRTSPTTSGRARGTSSTSPTRDAARDTRSGTPSRSPERSDLEARVHGSGRSRRRRPCRCSSRVTTSRSRPLGEIHQPDNLETTAAGSLMVTEDPGSSQQFPVGSTDPEATTARLWWVDLDTGGMTVAAKVDQSADEGPTDVDAAPAGNLGAWESSGVVDASEVYGPARSSSRSRRARSGSRRRSSLLRRPGAAQAGLHEEALRRAARAAPRSGRVANERGGSGLRAWPTLAARRRTRGRPRRGSGRCSARARRP